MGLDGCKELDEPRLQFNQLLCAVSATFPSRPHREARLHEVIRACI